MAVRELRPTDPVRIVIERVLISVDPWYDGSKMIAFLQLFESSSDLSIVPCRPDG